MAKGSLEDDPDESLEKWPPGWARYDWAYGYDQDDFDDYIKGLNACPSIQRR